MNFLRRPKNVLIAAMLVVTSTISLASGDEASVEQKESGETLQLAGIDYCHAGSSIDPNTGENVDLYVPCPEDGFEQNIDFA